MTSVGNCGGVEVQERGFEPVWEIKEWLDDSETSRRIQEGGGGEAGQGERVP